VSPVRYELGSYIPEDGILIITAAKTLNLIYRDIYVCDHEGHSWTTMDLSYISEAGFFGNNLSIINLHKAGHGDRNKRRDSGSSTTNLTCHIKGSGRLNRVSPHTNNL
jgi:hypothetical protein